jgi:hypothetical protein
MNRIADGKGGSPSAATNAPVTRTGKARTGILLWLLGVPIPIILLIFLIRGCM